MLPQLETSVQLDHEMLLAHLLLRMLRCCQLVVVVSANVARRSDHSKWD